MTDEIYVSNCCGVDVLNLSHGIGNCSDCYEGCSAELDEDAMLDAEQDELTDLAYNSHKDAI